jgi:MobA/MobL family
VAEYHCTAKIVSRGKGQSAVAKAAYNAREQLIDERTGEKKDYTRGHHSPVLFSGIFAPAGAPEWVRDRGLLWNRAEAAEKRKDSQLAREIEIALPYELTDQQRQWLITDFVRENFTRTKGMVADVNIHAPHSHGDDRNYHAHILLTTRRLDGEGFARDKAIEWNSRELYAHVREDLAIKGADMLKRAGFEVEAQRWRWGHLTQEQQYAKAIERGDLECAERKAKAPTRHRGPEIDGIERRGAHSEVQQRRAFEAAAKENERAGLAQLRAELAAVQSEIASCERMQSFQQETAPRATEIIRDAYSRSDNAEAFRAALAEKGLFLARADIVDARQLRIEASHAATRGGFIPEIESGDYVAVDTRGGVYAFSQHVTGDSRAEGREFFAPLAGDTDIRGVAETRAEFAPAYRERSTAPRAAAHDPEPMLAVGSFIGAGGRLTTSALDKVEGVGEEVAAALDTAADALSGGAAKLTPQERGERAAAAAYSNWKAAATAADRQVSSYQSIDRERR